MAKKTRLTESSIRAILAERAGGASVADLVKKHGISSATFYNWKAKFGDGASGAKKRGRSDKAAASAPSVPAANASGILAENAQLKTMIVDLMLKVEDLKAQLARR